jgi:hypothetical protein
MIVRLTLNGRILILSAPTPFLPPMRGCLPAGTLEIACGAVEFTHVGVFPALMGGSAYKRSGCYKRSAGLATPKGPRFSTCV